MYAVVDVETTGLDAKRDRVIDICAVLLDGEGQTERVLSSLVKIWPLPPSAPAEAYEHAPEFWEIADELVAALSGRVLVGQNIKFDTQMLQSEFIRFGVTMGCSGAYDTLAGDRLLHPKVEGSRSLHLIARRLELEERDWHTAEGDALATADLFRYQLKSDHLRSEAAKKPPLTFFGDLPGAGKPMVPRDPALFRAVSRIPKTWTEEELAYELPADEGPRGPIIIDSPELQEKIDNLLSLIRSTPQYQERRRLEDEAIATSGVMGRDEAYALSERCGSLKTRDQRKQLEAAALTFEVIDDKEELLAVWFRIAKMAQGHGDIEVLDEYLSKIQALYGAMTEDELEQHCYVAAEIVEWVGGRQMLEALAPSILKDENDGPGVIFWVQHAQALGVAEFAGAEQGLEEIALMERLMPEGSIDEAELRKLKWDVLFRGGSPDAAAYGVECWELGMGNDYMAAEAIKAMAADGEVHAALEFGRRVLDVEPNSSRTKAALGKIQREIDKL